MVPPYLMMGLRHFFQWFYPSVSTYLFKLKTQVNIWLEFTSTINTSNWTTNTAPLQDSDLRLSTNPAPIKDSGISPLVAALRSIQRLNLKNKNTNKNKIYPEPMILHISNNFTSIYSIDWLSNLSDTLEDLGSNFFLLDKANLASFSSTAIKYNHNSNLCYTCPTFFKVHIQPILDYSKHSPLLELYCRILFTIFRLWAFVPQNNSISLVSLLIRRQLFLKHDFAAHFLRVYYQIRF